MVAPPITEDYYLILEVEQTATPQLIVSSYKRLALKLHPDRNAKHDATEAFQRLARAYETLNDETKRRAYDLIYPSIRKNRQTPRPTASYSTPQADIPSEAAQLAAIRKSKQERSARWQTNKSIFDTFIFDLQRRIRQLQQEIENLDTIFAAEAAAEAWKNSWGAWLLSPIYKQAEESEEGKERKSRERQERRIERDMKERRMEFWNARLKEKEKLLKEARERVEAADRYDDKKIREMEAGIAAREAWEIIDREWKRLEKERIEREKLRQQRERQERERLEKEMLDREKERLERERLRQQRERQEWERLEKEMLEREKLRQQRERQEREAQEELDEYFRIIAEQAEKRRQEAENLAAQQQRATQAQNRHSYTPYYSYASVRDISPFSHISICRHDGWWPEVKGRTNCPGCDESWTYLLQCPGCDIKRCPKCQAAIRPVRRNFRARERTPSPSFYDRYDW